MSNEKALHQYITKAGEAEALIEDIKRAINEHHGVDPEKINWAHVGDMSQVASELRQIRDFICRGREGAGA